MLSKYWYSISSVFLGILVFCTLEAFAAEWYVKSRLIYIIMLLLFLIVALVSKVIYKKLILKEDKEKVFWLTITMGVKFLVYLIFLAVIFGVYGFIPKTLAIVFMLTYLLYTVLDVSFLLNFLKGKTT